MIDLTLLPSTRYRQSNTNLMFLCFSGSSNTGPKVDILQPAVDFPIQFNFGSPYSSSLTIFFDFWIWFLAKALPGLILQATFSSCGNSFCSLQLCCRSMANNPIILFPPSPSQKTWWACVHGPWVHVILSVCFASKLEAWKLWTEWATCSQIAPFH